MNDERKQLTNQATSTKVTSFIAKSFPWGAKIPEDLAQIHATPLTLRQEQFRHVVIEKHVDKWPCDFNNFCKPRDIQGKLSSKDLIRLVGWRLLFIDYRTHKSIEFNL